MEKLIEKLNLKDFQRICIINPESDIVAAIKSVRPSIKIDVSIDPRYLYNFFLVFVTSVEQVEEISPRAIHNLYEDGILWFAYRKNPGEKEYTFSKDNGWDILRTLSFKAVKQVALSESWNGIRFRNSRFVRSRIITREI